MKHEYITLNITPETQAKNTSKLSVGYKIKDRTDENNRSLSKVYYSLMDLLKSN